MAKRTALIDHLRAVLLERGLVVPQGRHKLEATLETFADEEEASPLRPGVRLLTEDLRVEWRALDERIAKFGAEFTAMARDDRTPPAAAALR